MTNTPNFIIQIEPSALMEVLLESKMPTDVYLLYGTGASVTPERLIPI